MRKVFNAVAALSLLPSMAISAGCSRRHVDICRGTTGIGCPAIEPQCDGICVAYMDASWDMALVGISDEGDSPLHCPESAPHAGVIGKELAVPGGRPRRVLVCSANPTPTCDTPTAVCMPLEPNFMACIVRDGEHECPSAYAVATPVRDESANPVTVCCEKAPELT